MRVRATQLGYYGYLREEGAEFEIEKAEHFSTRWMEKIAGGDSEAVSEDPVIPLAAPESGGGADKSVQTVEKIPVSGMGLSLEEAIKIATENGDVGANGKPMVSKLKELTGRSVTAEDRDRILDG